MMNESNLGKTGDNAIGLEQLNSFGDVYFSNLNGQFFSRISASSIYEQEFSNLLFENSTLYVIVGTDSGLLPRYLEKKGIPKGSRYFFIEPAVVLNELEKFCNFSQYTNSFAFANEENWLESITEYKVDEYFYIESVQIVSALCARDDISGLYAELSWEVTERLNHLKYIAGLNITSRHFITEQLLNIADNTHPVRLIRDVFHDKQVFILGGGPSLDGILPWLLEHRSSVIILAVSRITKRLLEFGIQPDLICSADPFPSNWDVSKEIVHLNDKVILIHAFHLYHSLLSSWTGVSFCEGSFLPWKSSLNTKNLEVKGPTITNIAVHLAVYLGFNRIYLAGVDYCFTLDGVTHAKGSIESSVGARFNLCDTLVERYDGIFAPSASDYLFAREQLEEQVAQYLSDNAHLKIYNLAMEAAVVDGIPYYPLDSIVLDEQKPNPFDCVNGSEFDKNRASWLNGALQEVRYAVHALKKIKAYALEAFSCNEHLYNEEGLIVNPKEKIRLDALEKKITSDRKGYSDLIKKFALPQFLKMTNPFMEEADLTASEAKISLRIYYETYVKACNTLLALLLQSEERILIRLEELKPEPDWKWLIDTCTKNQEYGRARRWLRHHAYKETSKELQEGFQLMESKFQQQLQEYISPHEDSVLQTSNLTILKSRAQILFKHQQKKFLEQLLLALDKHRDKEGVIPYRYLICGYLAELEGDNSKALDHYSELINHGTELIEEGLIRIVTIDLQSGGNGDLAFQGLTYLAQMDTRYLRLYAESCRIRGDITNAVDAYTQHITAYPKDVLAQIKLAQLFMDNGILEGAQGMVDLILEFNPEHEIALALKKEINLKKS